MRCRHVGFGRATSKDGVSAQAPPSITPLPPILWGRGKRQRCQPPLLPAYRTISRQKATAAAAVGFSEKELSATVSQQPIWNAPTSNGISTGQKRIIDQRWKKKEKKKKKGTKETSSQKDCAPPSLLCYPAVRGGSTLMRWEGFFYFIFLFSFLSFPIFFSERERKLQPVLYN